MCQVPSMEGIDSGGSQCQNHVKRAKNKMKWSAAFEISDAQQGLIPKSDTAETTKGSSTIILPMYVRFLR